MDYYENPNDMMIEHRLEDITYKDGLKELDPPFLLTCPSSIRISILDSRIEKPSDVSAAINDQDPQNLILCVFLPTLKVDGSVITWTNHSETFQQVMIHEFLHLCGDTPNQRKGVVDGIIRHNII